MSKFKVGDLVRVKSKEELINQGLKLGNRADKGLLYDEFLRDGTHYFINEMFFTFGRVYKIHEVLSDNMYLIYKGSGYYLDNWLEEPTVTAKVLFNEKR